MFRFQRAIHSMPVYIERCKYMFVLAPILTNDLNTGEHYYLQN